MRVLVACEFSGVVRNAFLRAGHFTVSYDLKPATSDYGSLMHRVEDVTSALTRSWDLVIAHPPCTYLCNSGVHWLHRKPSRWHDMRLAAEFFVKCLYANAPRVCVENPIPHKYAMYHIEMPYTQIIQPWQFGHNASKSTCLWLKGLPRLVPTKVLPKPGKLWANQSPGGQSKIPSRRGIERSITYQGIADAMVAQWGMLPTSGRGQSENEPPES